MVKEKRTFEILCAQHGFATDSCTQQELMRLEMRDAAAIAHAARAVELDRQEQKRLWLAEKARKLEEWREKLREAEIDLSMQRAALARERVDIGEKSRQLEEELENVRAEAEAASNGSKGKQAGRGRWLTRLGLRSKDEDG